MGFACCSLQLFVYVWNSVCWCLCFFTILFIAHSLQSLTSTSNTYSLSLSLCVCRLQSYCVEILRAYSAAHTPFGECDKSLEWKKLFSDLILDKLIPSSQRTQIVLLVPFFSLHMKQLNLARCFGSLLEAAHMWMQTHTHPFLYL